MLYITTYMAGAKILLAKLANLSHDQKLCAGEGRSARGGGASVPHPKFKFICTTIGLHTNICLTICALRHLQNLRNVGFLR